MNVGPLLVLLEIGIEIDWSRPQRSAIFIQSARSESARLLAFDVSAGRIPITKLSPSHR